MSVTVFAGTSRFVLSRRMYLALLLSSFAVVSLTGCSDHTPFQGMYPIPAVQIPAAPSAVTVAAGDSQITLKWSTVDGATSYNV